MVGNVQADNSGNILVVLDENNIIVVDPNKTVDNFGNVRERLVDHESLVMYANLECDVVPRTKLAVGGNPADRLQTISVAKMNFLKPTKNSYLGSGYYDELTGGNVTKYSDGEQILPPQSNNGNNAYVSETPDRQREILDTGLLGITSINVVTNASFVPEVEILLEDIQGKALFELGDGSPYSAFFNTQLDWVLRKAGIHTVVVCGIVTNGGVASTARDAHLRDYNVIVLSDGCAAFSDALHEASLADLASIGKVMTCDAWASSLV